MICQAARIRVYKGLRRIDLASGAGGTLGTVARTERGDVLGMRVESPLRTAAALEVLASEIIPALAVRLRNVGPAGVAPSVSG